MSTIEVIRYKEEFGLRTTDERSHEQVIAMLNVGQWIELGNEVADIVENLLTPVSA